MSIERFVFAHEHQPALQRLAARSQPIAAVAVSFPLLFFALATGYGAARARERALTMIDAGRPLKAVAAVLQLPMALRHVRPELLTEPLVDAHFTPEGARWLARIATRAGPTQGNAVAVGFYGTRLAGDAFGLWLAEHSVCHRVRQLEPVRWLALYAWASHQRHDPALHLAAEPWTPELPFRPALMAMKQWTHRLRWQRFFAGMPVADAWMRGGTYGEYEIAPLLSFGDLCRAAQSLPQSVGWCAERLAGGTMRFYHVAREGQILGTVALVWDGMDRVCQCEILPDAAKHMPPDAEAAIARWWADHAPWQGTRQAWDGGLPEADVCADIVARYERARGIGPAFWQRPFTWDAHLTEFGELGRSMDLRDPFVQAWELGQLRPLPARAGGGGA